MTKDLIEGLRGMQSGCGVIGCEMDAHQADITIQAAFTLSSQQERIEELEDILTGLIDYSKSIAIGNGLDHPTIGEQNFKSYLNEARKALKGE